MCLGSFEQSVAVEPSTADRDRRLVGVVGAGADIFVGVDERCQTVHLVLLQQAELDRRQHPEDRGPDQADEPPGAHAGHCHYREGYGGEDQYRPGIVLHEDDRRRNRRDRESQQHVLG